VSGTQQQSSACGQALLHHLRLPISPFAPSSFFIMTFGFEQKSKKARERASQTGRNDKWVKQNATLHPL
jgi:hypothetical protein